MALINCKNCEKQISDKADSCIHCGVTIITNNLIDNQTINDLDKELLEICKKIGKLAAVKHFKESTGLGLKESKDYVDILTAKHGVSGSNGTGGCFIATACYEDYNSLEVLMLRNFRDEKLLTNLLGSIFVKIYYFVSPTIAKKIEKSDRLKKIIRFIILRPIVNNIVWNKFKERL